MGEHRLLCGDSGERDHIARLFGGTVANIILSDPPYCSGGFQEAGRTAGSTTGVKNKPKVERDNLTTEGLEALLEKSFGRLPADGCCFIFCDWRQLFALRRTVEPLGFQYRALIVWDKMTPGMGGPWRHQHELIYFGTRRTEPSWGKRGDVLSFARTGNVHHTTEKPVDLLVALLEDTEGEVVADPFAGSGSTLLACERTGKRFYGMELTAGYCDVILARWEKATGREAELLECVN